jgi:hypothetical protein
MPPVSGGRPDNERQGAVPLSNVSPALAIILIAFAYLEEDGALLCGALAIAFVITRRSCWPHGKL